ncbi:MAG TPA: hypothetical protein VFA60_01500 [Terriglobales bacterium]|nr:hypothetical protein [Terriglobales bacterium]
MAAEPFGRYQNAVGTFVVEFFGDGAARITLWGARRLDAEYEFSAERLLLSFRDHRILFRRRADGSLASRPEELPGVLRRCA